MMKIDMHNVCWGYKKGKQHIAVLNNIELAIEPGEIIAILGQSGSGKSSLLNLISGIDIVDSGSINIAETIISDLDEQQRTLFRRRHIGFIYQFFNLIPTLTVAENIALVLELNGKSGETAQTRVRQLLSKLELEDRADDFPDLLSGGEQQRVAIARAIIHQPALILADEPTGNLDTHSGKKVLQLLIEQTRALNSSLLIVTHNLAVAKQADRMVALEDGKLIKSRGELAW